MRPMEIEVQAPVRRLYGLNEAREAQKCLRDNAKAPQTSG